MLQLWFDSAGEDRELYWTVRLGGVDESPHHLNEGLVKCKSLLWELFAVRTMPVLWVISLGPLVHYNIKHTHSYHSLNIFSTFITGSKVERYTEIAEQMVWICRVLLFDVLPSHFALINNQCEFKGLGSRDCLFSYMCLECASFFMLP